MKKIFSILAILVFITILSYNLKIATEPKKVAGIQLKNLEALACYDVELNGSWYATCCFPWFNTCCVLDLWTTTVGTYTL